MLDSAIMFRNDALGCYSWFAGLLFIFERHRHSDALAKPSQYLPLLTICWAEARSDPDQINKL